MMLTTITNQQSQIRKLHKGIEQNFKIVLILDAYGGAETSRTALDFNRMQIELP